MIVSRSSVSCPKARTSVSDAIIAHTMARLFSKLWFAAIATLARRTGPSMAPNSTVFVVSSVLTTILCSRSSKHIRFVRTLRSCAQRTVAMRDEVVRVVDGRFGATMSTSDQVAFFSLISVFKILLQSFCCNPVLIILVDGTINARETLGGKDGSHIWEVFLLSALVLCKDSVCTAVALVTCRFLFTDGAQNCCVSKPWPYFHRNTWPQAERHYSMRPVTVTFLVVTLRPW